MKKWIVIVISVLVVGFVGYQWYSAKTSSDQVSAQVRTAVVQKGKLEVKISGSGTVQPVTSEDITSPVDNNEIDEVLVSSGDTVTKGQELITFSDGSDAITAPAAGMITSISAISGGRVTSGQVVAHLTNYSDLQTVVHVDELDIPKIKTGQSASLTFSAYPDQTFTGKVTKVANEGTSSNGVSTFDVTIHIDNAKNLKVGMSAEASILTDSKTDALYVPIDAVHTANNQKYVVVAITQSSSAQQKTVKTGLANDDYVEITQGVTEGETIQLPQLASSTSTSSNRSGGMMQAGFGGAMGGGMPPSGGGNGGMSGN